MQRLRESRQRSEPDPDLAYEITPPDRKYLERRASTRVSTRIHGAARRDRPTVHPPFLSARFRAAARCCQRVFLPPLVRPNSRAPGARRNNRTKRDREPRRSRLLVHFSRISLSLSAALGNRKSIAATQTPVDPAQQLDSCFPIFHARGEREAGDDRVARGKTESSTRAPFAATMRVPLIRDKSGSLPLFKYL